MGDRSFPLRRRDALFGLAAAATTLRRARGAVCMLTPQMEEGPFYYDSRLMRADIIEGLPGVPLTFTINVLDDACAPMRDVRVDFWQADALGIYSGYAGQGDDLHVSAVGKSFLRGTQMTNADGRVRFLSLYPGWYLGRTTHLHYKIFLRDRLVLTAQIYFPDPLSDRIYATKAPYAARKAERDTKNAHDFLYFVENGEGALCDIREGEGGYVASLTAAIARTA